jgi:hypothetical protein
MSQSPELIKKYIKDHTESVVKSLRSFKNGPTNVYVLLDVHVDASTHFSATIQFEFALVHDFEKFEYFKLIFNIQDMKTYYNKQNWMKSLENDIFSQLMSFYTKSEIEKYMSNTTKGFQVYEKEKLYVTIVYSMLYCNLDFLKSNDPDQLGAYKHLGEEFKQTFPSIKRSPITSHQDILVKAIGLAASGVISVALLKKIVEAYQSKYQKTPTKKQKSTKKSSKRKKSPKRKRTHSSKH